MTLRLEPPFRAHYRHVVRDTELASVILPANARVLLLWGSANRDPDHIQSPDEFLLDRPNTKGHMIFGKGTHFCIGAPLARMEAVVALEALLGTTTWFDAVDIGPWLPSVLARRRGRLTLAIN